MLALQDTFSDQELRDFIAPQVKEHTGRVEVAPGLWAVFIVPAADAVDNGLARAILAEAPFSHDVGSTEDDRWTLYYVADPQRAEASAWVEDLWAMVEGRIRPVGPKPRALIEELIGSTMPHRVAQQLLELHGQGQLRIGGVDEPTVVRALFDRLHAREPLMFAALQSILEDGLIDYTVLMAQLVDEDVSLINEIVQGGVVADPLLQHRQKAASAIRNQLIQFRVINPLDQHKNSARINPYALFMDIKLEGDEITAQVEGVPVRLSRDEFVASIRAIRRTLYRGESFGEIRTQAPWMTQTIAPSFRFIRQRIEMRREVTPLDGLFMLERAVA